MFMRKIGTRLATVALIVVVMFSFSACALFATDYDKKYSPDIMVATVAGDDISISRQELYYGYVEWGYQYASSMASDELLEYITSVLVNTKILEKKSQEQFGDLRDAEIALALKQAYESLDETLKSYVNETLGLEDETASTETESTDDEVDQPYNPSILVSTENGERVYTMDLSSYADTEGEGTLASKDYTYYTPAIPGAASRNNAKQAISKIIRNLQTFETGFTKLKTPERDYLQPDNVYFKFLSSDERAVLNREIDRMVRSNQTSILVNRLSTAYNLGFIALDGDDARVAWDDYLKRGQNFTAWSDRINGNVTADDATTQPAYYGCGRTVATNTAHNAIDYYIEQVTNAINSQKNFPDSDLETTLMSATLSDVYYVPSDVANNLFTVSHILIGFTDEQKTAYTNINADTNPSANTQNQLNELYAATTSNGKTAYDIYLELQTALDKADTLQEKYQIFRQYINQYNSDPGMQNLEQLNSSTQKPQYEYLMSGTADNNSMVEAFTEASIELFENGIKGEISGLVWTEYGAHIIMYTRDLADFIYTGAAGMEKASVEWLKGHYADTLFAPLTAYGTRTRFDTLVDAYFTRSYSNYRYFVLNDYKNEHTVTIVNSEFKNFL
ncbi:MAG: hypothetical protein NC133_04195 [Prevotella sp.]|nr:hypothetical protein [Prevotella sp.]